MATVMNEEILLRLQQPVVVLSIVLMSMLPTVYIIGYSLTIIFNTKARIVRVFPDQDVDAEDGRHVN